MSTLQLPLADIFQNFEEIGSKTGFTPSQFIAQCVAATILFLLLDKFAWKPIRTLLEQRRKTIEESLAKADKIKEQFADAQAERLKIIQKANEQATAMLAEAEKSAAVRLEQRTKEATVQAEEIIRKAHEASVLERNRMMDELKREIGTLVIQTTEKVVGKVLTVEDQGRVNQETIRQLQATAN